MFHKLAALGITLGALTALCAVYAADDVPARLTVDLDANIATGNRWSLRMDHCDVLALISSDYITNASNLAGYPGTQRYVFEAQENGTVNLTFTYSHPWDEAHPVCRSVRRYTIKNGHILQSARQDFDF
jgi:predicted secreted protein